MVEGRQTAVGLVPCVAHLGHRQFWTDSWYFGGKSSLLSVVTLSLSVRDPSQGSPTSSAVKGSMDARDAIATAKRMKWKAMEPKVKERATDVTAITKKRITEVTLALEVWFSWSMVHR